MDASRRATKSCDASIAGQPEPFDALRVRASFPCLKSGGPAYLDNAATTQRPSAVLECLTGLWEEGLGNVHRTVHTWGQRTTERFEAVRHRLRTFLGAEPASQIVFVRGATEAINLVAQAWARPRLEPGDEIVLTTLEHHSNLVPWQLVAQATGARLRILPLTSNGELDVSEFDRFFGSRTKLLACAHVSNALGTRLPLEDLIERAHAVDARVLVDGAQAAAHLPLDLTALGADFYALSSHKAYGPGGIGALYARADALAECAPWQGGGDMIRHVTLEASEYAEAPHRFEAGTPAIEATIAWGAALEFLLGLDRPGAHRHTAELLERASAELAALPGLRLIGTARDKCGVVSFTVDGLDAHTLGMLLDAEGVFVRTGHHCAEPALAHFGLSETLRASFAMYNTHEEVERLVQAVRRSIELLR